MYLEHRSSLVHCCAIKKNSVLTWENIYSSQSRQILYINNIFIQWEVTFMICFASDVKPHNNRIFLVCRDASSGWAWCTRTWRELNNNIQTQHLESLLLWNYVVFLCICVFRWKQRVSPWSHRAGFGILLQGAVLWNSFPAALKLPSLHPWMCIYTA